MQNMQGQEDHERQKGSRGERDFFFQVGFGERNTVLSSSVEFCTSLFLPLNGIEWVLLGSSSFSGQNDEK